MKKLQRIVTVGMLGCMLALSGCGSGGESTTAAGNAATEAAKTTENKTESTADTKKDTEPGDAAVPDNEENWYFKKGDVKIYMYAPADPVIEALGAYKGEPFESPSCAFDGVDIAYSYPGFDLYVFDNKGERVITQVVLRDDTVQTAEGAYIGMDLGHVEKLYTAVEDGKNNLQLTKGNCTLMIIFKDDVVTSIQYSAKIDE